MINPKVEGKLVDMIKESTDPMHVSIAYSAGKEPELEAFFKSSALEYALLELVPVVFACLDPAQIEQVCQLDYVSSVISIYDLNGL